MAAPTPVVSETPLPSPVVLLQAAKLAMSMDRAIQLDYYADSFSGKAVIAEDQDSTTGEKILLKNREEFTSLIQKIFKAENDYIVLTENSIYIVHGNIKKRKLRHADLAHSD